MRNCHSWRLAAAGLALVALATPAHGDEAAEVAKKLQGQWTTESATQDGKSAGLGTGGITIVGDILTVHTPEGRDEKFRFKVDPSAKPAILTLEFAGEAPKNGAPSSAIYELAGDTLKLCLGPPDRRPTALSDKEGILVTLKRKKP